MAKFLSRVLPTLPQPLRVFSAATIVLTLVGIVVRFICAHAFHLTEYPYGYYVTRADGLDLMTFYLRFQYVHSPDFFSLAESHGPAWAYPGAVAPLYWILFRVRHAQIPFVLFGAGFSVVLGWFFSQALVRRGVARRDARWFLAILLLCSYPFYYEFARGNVEVFMWVVTALAVYCILQDRPWLGAFLLGLSIAMKIYPFVLLGLLLHKRRYLPIVFSLVVAVLYSLFGLWVLCPDIATAQRGVNWGIASFQLLYLERYRQYLLGMDHSLYGLVRRVIGNQSTATYARILHGYNIATALGGLIAYFARIRKLPLLNQVLCLTIAMIVLPPVSYDYTLIHMYVPFAMWALLLADRMRTGERVPALQAMLLCFIVLLSQVGEIIWHGDRLGGQIKCVTLLALFVVGLVSPLPSEWDRNEAAPLHA